MTAKDIKAEARRKLALNIHQAVIIYTIEFTLIITLLALIVMSCLCFNSISWVAAVVMICFGVMLLLLAAVGINMVNFALCDFYMASYKCLPYNVRRLGDTIARGGITKIFLISLKRTLLGFLLLLCLIVPGVIYLIRTSMANYLLIANPKMKASTALSASNKVMSGKTGGYFTLCISLIGWWLLGIVTLGFGFIFIKPYTNLIKATYYKRNLQGDKGDYKYVPQPVSLAQGEAAYSQPAAVHVVSMGEPAVQPVAEAQAAPIDALAEDDFNEMNDAMRDFGGGVVSDTSDMSGEIPIPPPTTTKQKHDKEKKEKKEKKKRTVAVTEPDAPVPHVIEGTGLVETERTLTTMEIQENGSIENKFDAMYSRVEHKPAVDYVAGFGKSSVNEFVTQESFTHDGGGESIPDFEGDIVEEQTVEPVAEPIPMYEPIVEPVQETVIEPVQPIVEPVAEPVIAVEPMAEPVAEPEPVVVNPEPTLDAVMSDEQFAEFLSAFDNDMKGESDNLDTVPPHDDSATSRPSLHRERPSAGRERPSASANRADMNNRTERAHISHTPPVQEDRAERIRREREERLKNLKK